MGEVRLLSELCSICYTEKPKYRCPRCKTQTCSLTCYKRHQQRASCNGKRDPATYLKKSDWATANGIDQDFNYLKGIERVIDCVSEDASQRGIGTHSSTSKNIVRGWRVDSALQHYLNQNRITVEHAPKGMSKQKVNQTRPTKRSHIVWTVEWINGEGQRFIQHDCAESSKLVDLYGMVERHRSRRERTEARARSHVAHDAKSAKRKRSLTGVDNSQAAVAHEDHPEAGRKDEGVVESNAATHNVHQQLPAGHLDESDLDQGGGGHAQRSGDRGQSTELQDLKEVEIQPEHVKDIPTNYSQIETETQPQQLFYLLRPGTISSSNVLIPLQSGATLTEALQDRVVQEYPTFYVFSVASEVLPSGFVLEKEYLRKRRDTATALHVTNVFSSSASKHLVPGTGSVDSQAEPLDAQTILEMLKRDVNQ